MRPNNEDLLVSRAIYFTFEQNEEPSYDILCKEENCLYKHILESEIIERTEQGEC